MRKNLFWLSDEQWKRIEPHLPTDIRGVERADGRRVDQRHRACAEKWLPLMRLSSSGASDPPREAVEKNAWRQGLRQR
jgi:transposase